MNILAKWVMQIIIFIIIAIIVDLIIPQNAMKKYIKLVVGLILMLILLQPIFSLFHTNIAEKVGDSVKHLMDAEKINGTVENSTKIQKKEIQGTKHAYIFKEMTVQLKKVVKKELSQQYQAQIDNIDFQFTDKQKPSWETLDKVIVHLGQFEEGEGAVPIVKKIDIHANSEPTDTDEQDVADIKKLLSKAWGIDEVKLTVIWKGGST